MKKLIVAATFLALAGVAVGVAVANTLNSQPAYCPVTYSRCAPVAVSPRPVFITPQPLMNVNYDYGRGHPGRGQAHGYGR
jgi:hypothetical protein